MSDGHQDGSRTHSHGDVNKEEEEEAGSSSRQQPRNNDDDDDRSGSWLRLGIGSDAAATSFNNGSENAHQTSILDQTTASQRSPPSGGCRLIELDLLSSGDVVSNAPPPQVFQVAVADHLLHYNFTGVDSSLSSSTCMGTYFCRPFPVHAGGPSSDVRIIAHPRRPHVGVWFMLQASPIQAKEPLLPQIPKSYLRIKDGKTTIGLLVKYLVNKLRLDSELEVEIRCRGQELEPFLTLQHVRDNIWYPPNSSTDFTLLSLSPSSSSTTSTLDHVMLLHYARSL